MGPVPRVPDHEARSVPTGAAQLLRLLACAAVLLGAAGCATVEPVPTEWARQFGTATDDVARAVAVDGPGSVWVAGFTDGDLSGAGSGAADAFVRRYDSRGAVSWAEQFGTDEIDQVLAAAAGSAGRLAVAGETVGDLASFNLGERDVFVRLYDAAGAALWTRQFGTSASDFVGGVAMSPDGSVLVAGYTDGSLDIESLGLTDAFLRKFSPAGDVLWSREFGTAGRDLALDVAVDADGNAYVTGFTYGQLEGPNAGGSDAYVRRYSSAGDPEWTRQFGTDVDDFAETVVVLSTGLVAVGGETVGDLETANGGATDGFVGLFTAAGDPVWTRQFGTSSFDYVNGAAVDSSDTIILTGHTLGGLFGSAGGPVDAFVVTYSPGGDLSWAHQFGTVSEDVGYAVAVDAADAVYVAGFTLGALAGDNSGGKDAYVRKLLR